VSFASAREVTRYTSELIRPPRRMLPSTATQQYLETEKGRWDPSLSPMMVEPLDLLASREYQGVIFVGPARTGKTMSLILGGITYAVMCAPGDVLVTQMSQDTARDFSLTDLDRAIRHSPALRDALSPRARDDNTYDKFFRSGMRLKVGWPSISQLSSKTLRYVFLTDYDRPENRDNVEGEGPLWDLGAKRVETYMSRGKCFAESSPDSEYLDAGWKPSSPHEGPPSRGIAELYNRGTRARFYWPCLHCGEYFQAAPGLDCFPLPPLKELEELVRIRDPLQLATEYARVACPECGALHEQSQRPEMSARGRWVHEGQSVSREGIVTGARRGTQIASFWLGGVAATFQSWESLILKYLQALASYLRTGEESALKFTVNTDQGAAYLPRVASKRRSTDELQKRLENWPVGKVPPGVRFLTAAVDVQSNRFVVHVMGWGVGLESWLIDRFLISASKRPEGERFAALEPAAYLEDWDVLLERVIERTYPMVDANASMPVRLVVGDSGGKSGVTAKAYAYYRWLRRRRKHFRFRLVKGSSRMDAATATLTWPDASDRKDRKQGGRGDVPVWLLNTTVLKDAVVGDLARTEMGPGFVHLPKMLEKDESFFAELAAEQRTEKGWKNPSGARNEALDLHVYNRAACKIMKADKINWANPPRWAREAVVDAEPVDEVGEPDFSPPTTEPPRVQRPFVPRRSNWVKGWR
jgi:phage terminase large subunit GpA-like protein